MAGRLAYLPTLLALAAGVIFVSFGVGHFAHHAAEVGDFRRYQVPFAGFAVWVAGVVETSAGMALLLGLFVRPAAALLAADMLGVVATAGRVEGGLLNLGLAPLLLVMMSFLLWAGPGAVSLDSALDRRARGLAGSSGDCGRVACASSSQVANSSSRFRKNSRAAAR